MGYVKITHFMKFKKTKNRFLYNIYIDQKGNKYWLNDKGQYHRIDGPAIEHVNWFKVWYQYSKRHRLDGPAIEYSNGEKEWWQFDIQVNPNIKTNHNICKRCKTKCHNEPKLINIPIECKYELEHIAISEGSI